MILSARWQSRGVKLMLSTKMKKTGNAHLVYGVEICVVVDATDDDRDDGME